MRVDLRTLHPNPMRDFTIDPIDEAVVAMLRTSIAEDGFWGGIVCRRQNGHVQIGAGHHRVQAAVAAGVTLADVFVADKMDDAAMVRVYARENATQRGNSGTALTGTVAAAMKYVAKCILTGATEKFFSSFHMPTLRDRLLDERGVGRDVLMAFLGDMPGINDGSVQQQLANLKASGDYARLIADVEAEIAYDHQVMVAQLADAERKRQQREQERREAEEREREAEAERQAALARARAARDAAELQRQAEEEARAEQARQRAEGERKLAEQRQHELEAERQALEALRAQEEATQAAQETARQAAAKAAERPRTFDFEGVAKHLTNAYQIQVFREIVTSIGIQSLPVERQAELAALLVERSKQRKHGELTGQFIREHTMALWLAVQHDAKRQTQEEQEALARKDLHHRALHYQRQFIKYVNLLTDSAVKIDELAATWPPDLPFPMAAHFVATVERVAKVTERLRNHLQQVHNTQGA